MAESNGNVKAALKYLDKNFDDFKRTLVELSRIPSISAEGFPAEEVRRSAEGMAGVLRAIGIENVEVLEIPGVHPYVYGDWLHRAGRADDPALRPPRRPAPRPAREVEDARPSSRWSAAAACTAAAPPTTRAGAWPTSPPWPRT